MTPHAGAPGPPSATHYLPFADRVFAVSNAHPAPCVREKEGCTSHVGGTNSVSVSMFLILLFMRMS